MTDQPYQTPQSDLQVNSTTSSEYGSIEKAISGDYSFEVGEILQEAWDKTSGTKGSVIAAGLIMYAIVFAISFVSSSITVATESAAMAIITQLIVTIVMMPMYLGIMMIGVRRSVDQPFTFTMIFQYFGFIVPLFLTMIVLYFMVGIGILLLVIPGIYLSVAYSFAMLLVIEKRWEFGKH